ncbi:aldo/keto reductase [Haloplasma contractile]|uniref:1-deoxy-D-xylulose-5-phosphate reductoisomerase protein n=1 Tax=Haloplasma contractile SSD-17B TaxID=1033810 RepID=U2EBF0_9MOLU|nr:aldo/keto reductase [Haloplasma contractile]ERJ12121.1 1-deoxy-D-xylulose-5-phosphate reductoisomerase protein [Haloplasma contractile SSD-17B]
MKNLKSCAVLNNGIEMPWVGFGTFKVEDGKVTKDAVKEALKAGYRHIDTAMIYGNESSVGDAIKESDIPREDIFVTTKVWNSDQGYESTLKAFEDSLDRLGLDYLDLYLIHWPKDKNLETWKALEKLYREEKIRAIGVSNFKIHHLEAIKNNSDIIPVVNQVECHPQFPQDELKEYCEENGIRLEAWGPLMQGQIFDKPVMKELAEKHDKTVAQIALRWQLQRGVIVIPKSVTPERIHSNTELFDFELTDVDLKKIATLNTEERIGPDPDEITF